MNTMTIARPDGPVDQGRDESSVPLPAETAPQREPPRGLLRWLFDVPEVVYRLRFGWIFGRRFLLLTHRGRRTGVVRRTVVEAVSFDAATFESVVVAGWGDRTNWYRNVVAGPALEVETGGRRYRPTQRVLAPDEVRAVLEGYVTRNPWAGGVMERLGLDPTGASPGSDRRIAHLRGVAFRPDQAMEPRVRRARRRRTTRRVYDVLARGYDRLTDPFESGLRAVGLRWLDARPGETIVEFGSGTGRALAAIGGHVGAEGRVIGLDLSSAMVDRARRRLADDGVGPWVTTDMGDAIASGLGDGSADGVFLSFVLESASHEDRAPLLAECRRVLRPDGRLVVVALDRPDRPGLAVRAYELVHRLVPQIVDCAPMQVVQALRDAAFEIEAVEAHTMTGLPVAVVRARRARA